MERERRRQLGVGRRESDRLSSCLLFYCPLSLGYRRQEGPGSAVGSGLDTVAPPSVL